MYTIRVVRADDSGTYTVEYEGPSDGNRVETRLMIERLQDTFDRDGDPLRAYMVKSGFIIEAAYGLREARD